MKRSIYLSLVFFNVFSYCQVPTGIDPLKPVVLTRDYISDISMTYPFGGPIAAIAVNPFSSQHIVLAGETGGLFETTNAISSDRKWKHLSEFNHYVVEDVLITSAPGGFELWAVTASTFKNIQMPAIWKRKVDGQWVQASFPNVRDRSLELSKTNTFRIIKNPFYDGRMYACGDYGVAIKENNSNSWNIKSLPFGQAVYSIACSREGDIAAATTQGIYVSPAQSNGDNWILKRSNTSIANSDRHRFRLNSDANGSIFLAVITDADGQNYRIVSSVDRGESWQTFMTPVAPLVPAAGGYVSVYPFFDVLKKQLTIYVSNQYEFNYAVAEGNTIQEALASMQRNPSLTWKGKLNSNIIGHDDTRHLVLLNKGVTIPKMIISSDGGLHIAEVTGDATEKLKWMTENTRSGLKNSQVVNITGDRKTFYFGTWHTGFGASTDGGKSFSSGANVERKIFGGEGYVVPMNGASGNYNSNPIVGGELKFSTKIFGLTNNPENFWNSPSSDNRWGPVYLLENTFLQQATRENPAHLFPWKLTLDNGRTWQNINGTLFERFGFGCFSRASASSSKFNYYTGLNEKGVIKIGCLTNYYPGNEAQWIYPELRNLDGGVGVFDIGAGTQTGVFGVSPFDRTKMLAVEQATGKLKISNDGGTNWTESTAFTSLYENAGKNVLKNGYGYNAISCISFSPFTENVALVSTISEGIFLTKDGGITWKKLNNPGILLPTSFYWHSSDAIFLATYGRGIFKITL